MLPNEIITKLLQMSYWHEGAMDDAEEEVNEVRTAATEYLTAPRRANNRKHRKFIEALERRREFLKDRIKQNPEVHSYDNMEYNALVWAIPILKEAIGID